MSNAKVLKGVLIDPVEKEIRRVEVRPDERGSYLYSIRDHIGIAPFGCVDVVRERLTWLPSKPQDDIWVDDNMLDNPFACVVPEEGLFLYGKVLILGWTMDGECSDTTLLDDDIDAIRNAVTFRIV